MFKKIIFVLLIFILVIIGVRYYNSQKTVECWWGVMYPSLSFIAFEEEDENEEKISSLDTNFTYTKKEEPVKVKIGIIEWIKNLKEKR